MSEKEATEEVTEEASDTAEEAPSTAEVEPTEVEKPEVEKRKRVEKKIFSYYRVDEKGLTRLRPSCERCGPGYFMADHGNRFTCGHCGFTRYKQDQLSEESS